MQYSTGLHVFINMHARLRVEKQQHHYISLNTCTMVTEAGKAACCFSSLLTSNFLALQTEYFFASNRKLAGWRCRSLREKKKGKYLTNIHINLIMSFAPSAHLCGKCLNYSTKKSTVLRELLELYTKHFHAD